MKTHEYDLLASRSELKNTPYGVPEGYFESFKADISKVPAGQTVSLWKRAVPYMAAAACLAVLLSVGTLMLTGTGQTDTFTQEDYILFSDNLISTSLYEEHEPVAELEMQEEDIIEYLIYIGISPETIELSK